MITVLILACIFLKKLDQAPKSLLSGVHLMPSLIKSRVIGLPALPPNVELLYKVKPLLSIARSVAGSPVDL
jgi:hypothetical protein